MKYFAFFFAFALTIGPACETPDAERAADLDSASESGLAAKRLDQLVARAERLRDRTFENPPSFHAVARADALPVRPAPSNLVVQDREVLLAQLFGRDEPLAKSQPQPLTEFARYQPEQNRIVYVEPRANEADVELSILAALVEAIDAQHFDALPQPMGWDQQLALRAAEKATTSFALAGHLLQEQNADLDPALLARRPELAAELPGLAAHLEATSSSGDAATPSVAARESAFAVREGLALAAALYRSNGWSGIELARALPPIRTGDVVRPDHWMSGEPIGQWTWPESDELTDGELLHSGAIGPAVTSMWLAELLEPRVARTVYAGWVTDSYRFFEQAQRFEWLSLWSTPDSAASVARAFEMRLRRRFSDKENAADHFVVFQKGLKVGVLIGPGTQAAKKERARTLLAEHKLTLAPREELPLRFEPTRRDLLAEKIAEATLEGRVWTDPATGLRLDLTPLGDGWQVQQPDAGAVRWFARHKGGSLLQLTTELSNPLGPTFNSQAYRETLVDNLEKTVDDAEIQQIARADATPGAGLVLRLSGKVNGEPRILHLWQFERGDLLVTYSLQARPKLFDAHKKLAKSILMDARKLDLDAESKDDQERDEGIIEYEVEE